MAKIIADDFILINEYAIYDDVIQLKTALVMRQLKPGAEEFNGGEDPLAGRGGVFVADFDEPAAGEEVGFLPMTFKSVASSVLLLWLLSIMPAQGLRQNGSIVYRLLR